jgi:hypothetical protein
MVGGHLLAARRVQGHVLVGDPGEAAHLVHPEPGAVDQVADLRVGRHRATSVALRPKMGRGLQLLDAALALTVAVAGQAAAVDALAHVVGRVRVALGARLDRLLGPAAGVLLGGADLQVVRVAARLRHAQVVDGHALGDRLPVDRVHDPMDPVAPVVLVPPPVARLPEDAGPEPAVVFQAVVVWEFEVRPELRGQVQVVLQNGCPADMASHATRLPVIDPQRRPSVRTWAACRAGRGRSRTGAATAGSPGTAWPPGSGWRSSRPRCGSPR